MDGAQTTDALVGRLLAAEYGIAPAAIVEGPRGWMGETFIVTAADGRRVFAKALDEPDHFGPATAALPVLEALRAAGITNLSMPVRTRQGQIAVDFDGRRLIVLEFIDGRSGSAGPYDFARYVRTLARIHAVRVALPPGVPREDYALSLVTHFPREFERALDPAAPAGPPQELRRFLQGYEARIRELWLELLPLPDRCRQRPAPFVITHSDSFEHNLLITADGEVHLIDWDELMLGPVERDTWYHALNPATRRAFLATYRETFPGYRADPLFCRYYLLRRFFEDLGGFLEKILDTADVEQQRDLLPKLTGSWNRWLWPLIDQPDPAEE